MENSSSCAIKPFQYPSLEARDTIRVLMLDPAESYTDPLRGSLVHVSRYAELARLNRDRSFSAVSYTWGEPDKPERILLRGNAESAYEGSISITKNAKSLLQHLRHYRKVRRLWIDAICLNQNDKAEKSQQIPLMGEIYRQADKVYIWLGPVDGDDVGRVFAYFNIAALAPPGTPNQSSFKDQETEEAEIGKFLCRDWFFRRWILQEAALARNGIIHCGQYTIPYSVFASACRLLKKTVFGASMYAIDATLTIADSDRRIDSLLWKLHRSASFEKKDRIAALYGFIPQESQLRLDYTRSYHEIYTQQALALVESSLQNHLIVHLFGFGRLSSDTSGKVSSWVPDWSKERCAPVPLCFNPYNDEEQSNEPNGLRSFRKWQQAHIRNIKADFKHTYRSVRSVSEDQVFRHLFAWRQWLSIDLKENKSSMTYTWNREAEPPCTIFWPRRNQNGQHVLNVSWINPWAHLYGREITTILSITKEHIAAKDPTILGDLFRPLTENFKEQGDLIKFYALCEGLEVIMARIEPLKSPDSSDSTAAQVLASEICNLPGLKYSLKRRSKDRDLTSVDYILDLLRNLYEAKLTVLELHLNHYDISYAVGPSNLQKGMRLIPLESRLPGRTTGQMERILWYDKLNSRSNGASEISLTNMMVVRPHIDEDLPKYTISTYQSVVGKLSGKARIRLPLTATYISPCVLVATSRLRKSSMSDEPRSPSDSGPYGTLRQMLKDCKHAENSGMYPPYTIDIL